MRARPSMPKSEWSLSNNIRWLIVSKAADRSRPTMTAQLRFPHMLEILLKM